MWDGMVVVIVDMHAGQNQGGLVGRMSGDAGALPECAVMTLITPPSRCAALGMVEPELVVFHG